MVTMIVVRKATLYYIHFVDQTEQNVTVIARGIFHSSFMINSKRSN